MAACNPVRASRGSFRQHLGLCGLLSALYLPAAAAATAGRNAAHSLGALRATRCGAANGERATSWECGPRCGAADGTCWEAAVGLV